MNQGNKVIEVGWGAAVRMSSGLKSHLRARSVIGWSSKVM